MMRPSKLASLAACTAISHSLLALSFLLPAELSAQGKLELTACTQGLGRATSYQLAKGRRALPFFFLTSFQRGQFPLAAIDPRDPRRLGVGLELLSILLVASFDAQGKASFSFPIPNDASLVGKAMLQQAIGFPGTTTTFGALSPVLVVPFEKRGAWRLDPTKSMFQGRAWGTLIDEGDGRYLVVGGGSGGLLALQSFDTTERFDLRTGAFQSGPRMMQHRGVHTNTLLSDGRTLVVGGVDRLNDPQDSCELYSPKSGKFSAGAKLKGKRMAHAATLLADGRVLVSGGLSDLNNQLKALGSALSSTEIYDPRSNKWTAGPAMSEPKAGHASLLLADGRVLLIGGVTWRTFLFLRIPSFSKLVDIFDPKTGKITAARAMKQERAGFSSFRLQGGKVLVVGGVGGSITSGGLPHGGCELYDPKAGTWSRVASLPKGRALGVGLMLRDGRPAVLGGAVGTLLAPIAVKDCSVYDVAANRWAALPALVSSRSTHLAFEATSCPLIVIGGGSGKTATAIGSSEILVR